MSALAVEAKFTEPLQKIAEIQISEGKTDLAIRRISEQIQAVPDHSRLHSYYGTVLTKARQVDRAEAAYLKAISLDDHNLGAYLGLENLYREGGRSDEAIV